MAVLDAQRPGKNVTPSVAVPNMPTASSATAASNNQVPVRSVSGSIPAGSALPSASPSGSVIPSASIPSLPLGAPPKPPAFASIAPGGSATSASLSSASLPPTVSQSVQQTAQQTPIAPLLDKSAPVQPPEDSSVFQIDLIPRMIDIPSVKTMEDKRNIDVRYPLMPPYAYAHIFWDADANELVYHLEEAKLDDGEKELLALIQLGLEEMINISFIRAAQAKMLIKYLERSVQNILVELGTKISKKSYQKIMYYIYRNSVGLNEIEPLMNDYYIEDIECNGLNFPLYIVHRKYENMRTNVMFTNDQYMTDFVEKLAQKSGRYISYAKPLLDGTLPDGSRVNATYTEDVTTRGPTFTIRKFTKDPWTPISLIINGTTNAEVFAYLWLAIEHKFNIMIVGETASGKTTFLNAIANFIPPEAHVCSIEDTREINISHDNWLPAVTRAGFGEMNIRGVQTGEITLFDLLRETFRQNPDYVIVGEVRGEEAYVLFQGMASGHPSFCTFHAGSLQTVVKRLETPPISLSPSLVKSLDVMCIISHAKGQGEYVRRLTEVDEIIDVEQQLGSVKYNAAFMYDPLQQQTKYMKSTVFEKIAARTGISVQQLEEELKRRASLLQALTQRNIVYYKDVAPIINAYYKNPAKTLAEFGL